MVDSDMEGDTADTQETAATEITQATRSTPLSVSTIVRQQLYIGD